ncbi:MAG: hypothetical protein ABIG90_01240 [bacterium]
MARINLMPEGFKSQSKPKFIIILIIGYLLFGLSVISFAGFYSWQVFLQKNLNNLEKQISSLSQEQLDQPRINRLGQLLNNHIYWSQVFPRIEKTTLADVYFSSFSGDSKTGIVNLIGNVSSYSILAKQVKAFEQEFQQVKFSTSGLAKEGGLNINIELHGVKLFKD